MHDSENLGLVIVDEGDPADLNTVSANFEEIDDVVGSLVDAMTNAKALLGQLGLDSEGNPVVNAAQARSTLGAAPNSVIGTVPSGETLQGQIDTLQDSVAMARRNVIVIGDSYVDNEYDWSFGNYIQTIARFGNYFLFGNGGAGFSHDGIRGEMNGMNFYRMITYASPHIGTLGPDNITDVAFVGGWNDGGHTVGAFTYGIFETTINYAKTMFPNATIHIVYVYAGNIDVAKEHRRVRSSMQNWSQQLGVLFSSNVNSICYFDSPDGIHPSAGTWSQFLGGFTAMCIAFGPQPDLEYTRDDCSVTSDHMLIIHHNVLNSGETPATPILTSKLFSLLKHPITASTDWFFQGVANFGGNVGWDSYNLRVCSAGVMPQLSSQHRINYTSGQQIFVPEMHIQVW